MWTLILTMVMMSTSGGTAITQVPGFTSKEKCLAAGDAWLADAGRVRAMVFAVCVQQ